MVVNDEDTDGLTPIRLHLSPIRLGWNADSHSRSRLWRARDCEPPADLGGTAVHRVQAEVPGVSGGWVEAQPVVANLEDDAALLSLDANVHCARLGVLLGIRERLPPDREQLCLHSLGQRESRSRSADVDGDPGRIALVRGVLGERRDQPSIDRVAVQRE